MFQFQLVMVKQKQKKKTTGVKKKVKSSVPLKLFLVLNILVVLPLLCSYFAAYLPPDRFWPIAFIGLAYPVLVILNLLFTIFWLILVRKYFIISLLAIALGWPHILTHIRFNTPVDAGNKMPKIKVMSYNVRLFDLYNWKDNKSRATRDKIFNLINTEAPDIICFQEFYGGDERHFNVMDTLLSFQQAKNYHVSYIRKKNRQTPFGIAIFSRFPIIHNQEVTSNTSGNNFCIFSDLYIGKDTVRVINTHLESIRLGREDYLFVSDLASNRTEKLSISEGSLKIFGKMRSAYRKRAEQVRAVRAEIDKSPYPVILCGDFNDTPSSYAYHQVAQKLKDSFVEAGSGMGKSYSGILPSFRIDYIFHDTAFSAYQFRTIQAEYSDHYPVTTFLEWNQPRQPF
jgi:endonuclease/exonuclease/phosphatase family metal-dependent hydrolase